jgi:hypothetical protein
VLEGKEGIVPFEQEWRRNLRRRLEPEGNRDSGGRWRSRQPGAGARPDEVDLFASYTPGRESARELVEPHPAAPAPPAPAATPPRRRPRRLLAVVGVLLALAASAAGGAVFERGRIEAAEAQFPSDVQVVTRPVPVPQVPPACQSALDKASEALGVATEVEQALAEHTNVMDQLMQGKLAGPAALRAGMPSTARGARASVRFDRAAADYRDLSRQCGP